MTSKEGKRRALLPPPYGDVFLILYLVVTLGGRFLVEDQLAGRPLISIGLGIFALILLWALKRVGFFAARLWP